MLHKNIIPNLSPYEFDAHFFFANWQAPNYGFYNQFHIEKIEIYKDHLTLPIPPHRRSVNFFVFLKTGTIIRSKGLTQYEVRANECFFLPAEQITSIESVSPDATGYYCHFRSDVFWQVLSKIEIDKVFSFFQIASEPIVSVTENERILTLIGILEEEYHLNKSERFGLLALYLTALLTEIKLQANVSEMPKPDAANRLTQRYKNALSVLIYEKRSVAEFADYLHVSPNHLQKCVKSTTGKSAHDLLNEMRILEAKVLLSQTNLSIGEIAFKIGQFESSDFGRLFKKSTQVTPKQYRTGNF